MFDMAGPAFSARNVVTCLNTFSASGGKEHSQLRVRPSTDGRHVHSHALLSTSVHRLQRRLVAGRYDSCDFLDSVREMVIEDLTL